MTKTEAVLEVLRRAKKPLDSKDIAERAGLNSNTVRGILRRLQKEGQVFKESGYSIRF